MVATIRLTGDQEKDMAVIEAAYRGRLGLHPELAAPIKLAPPKGSGDQSRQA